MSPPPPPPPPPPPLQMRVLNKSLAFLNHSLEDVQAIQVGMASVHSEISRYTSALNELRSEVGDLSDGFDVKVGFDGATVDCCVVVDRRIVSSLIHLLKL